MSDNVEGSIHIRSYHTAHLISRPEFPPLLVDTTTHAKDSNAFRHVPALDGLRAIAVTIVMLSHVGLGHIIPGGFGVTIFFFLSGYLITSLLRLEKMSNGYISLKGFYFRRTLRIFPPLYITILITWIISSIGLIRAPVDLSGVSRDILFLSNYGNIWTKGSGLQIPLWSIDVEEHFYIIFSFSYAFFLSRLKPRSAAVWCALACLVTLAIRIFLVRTIPIQDYNSIHVWSHTRLDSILFGCCLALWQNPKLDGPRAWRPKIWHIVLAFGVLLACFAIRNPVFRESLRYSLQGASLFVIFSAVLHSDRSDGIVQRILCSSPLRWGALLSYTLYLGHLPVMKVIEQQFPGLPVAAEATLMIVGSTIYALAMHFLIERPLARWRSSRSLKLQGVGQPLSE